MEQELARHLGQENIRFLDLPEHTKALILQRQLELQSMPLVMEPCHLQDGEMDTETYCRLSITQNFRQITHILVNLQKV